ncbi:MAG: bifunctional diaminohydroxyphosphoribosylaminopyrimidine deaminase/5-amino-6-(5-phosphoribosylamino)uracil reductase RibD [Gemmatimonas sp.]
MTAASRSAEIDTTHMQRALALAELGWGQTAPNPMVGAVVVAGRAIVGEGYHARYGEAHAEVIALRDAGERARRATLYVSLEPCTHHGKTPPCTDAIIAAGVARVVVAVRDPSPVARGGVETLRAAGIHVDVGISRSPALELNAAFFNAHTSDRPWVVLKLAVSADGAIADATRRPRWITSPASRAEVHRLRAGFDAIAVGAGTVLTDDPALTVRDVPAPRVAPRRVVFDSTLRTPPESVLVRTARQIPTIIVARESDAAKHRKLEDAGVTIISASSTRDALRQLRRHEIRSLLVEGGAKVAGSLLADDSVDRLIIFQSPIELGIGALGAFADAPPGFAESLERRPIVERRAIGDDTMTTYALHEIPCLPD